ncbi:MAG: inorganic phosphate transporter, partial [Candidatus Izemoplasmatales bacterium]|nr:inorganic phosphate transporter [Candidatus Izemoplasmatales bacterium]
MGLLDFLRAFTGNWILAVTVILVLLVVLINGWTDAPNAIATCISTRAISPKKAIIMAAIFNLFGVLFMTLVNATVAETLYKMVDFSGNSADALAALCAALVGILIWAVMAWYYGIPTSESHALIAGISGAAIALQGGFSGINGSAWVNVIYGLLLSTFFGFLSGYGISKLIVLICKDMHRRKTNRFFLKAQVAGGASMAFMHG